MALGVDTAAHESALKAGGFTVAVWGGGLLKLFPAENACLAEIIAEIGLDFDEYPPDTHATKFTFPSRNRIVSGLSDGVFVAEAREKTAPLITACAMEQGRQGLCGHDRLQPHRRKRNLRTDCRRRASGHQCPTHFKIAHAFLNTN
jgi:predicted Rossmann fold nucleotide-binding protein DprA/Smf involved in DNA uptake